MSHIRAPSAQIGGLQKISYPPTQRFPAALWIFDYLAKKEKLIPFQVGEVNHSAESLTFSFNLFKFHIIFQVPFQGREVDNFVES